MRRKLIALAVAVVLLASLAVAAVEMRWTRRFDTPYPAIFGKAVMAFAITPTGSASAPARTPRGATIERGEYLANDVSSCVSCHTDRGGVVRSIATCAGCHQPATRPGHPSRTSNFELATWRTAARDSSIGHIEAGMMTIYRTIALVDFGDQQSL